MRILGRRKKEEKERREGKKKGKKGKKKERRKIAASCGRKCDTVKVVSKGRVVRTLHSEDS